LIGYNAGLLRYLSNSAVVSALTVFFTLVLSIVGGYAFPGSGSGGGTRCFCWSSRS
jgi:ABC-type glycerol-3-phosphate transport system permease component